MPAHLDSWTVPVTGQYVAKCGGGGGSGIRGQADSPYRGAGGGGGATASRLATETAGHVVDLLIPDPGPHNVLQDGSQAEYGYGGSSLFHCLAAPGKLPGFFGPVGRGGLDTDCIGDVKTSGFDGDGPSPDFSIGPGHKGGNSADGTPGGTGGAQGDHAGGQDGPSPGGGGGGYIIIWRHSDWLTYPAGNPTAAPIAIFGTPPPPPISSRRVSSFIM